MKKFNLDKWLQDKSRKVIDDDGFPVEIIKWDVNKKMPVVYLNHNGIAYNVSADGMYDADPSHGIFFADEEEELTEFEKEVAGAYEWAKTTEREDFVNEFAPKLFDLARKLLTMEPKCSCDKDTLEYKKGYEQGERDFAEQQSKRDYIRFQNHRDEINHVYELGKEDAFKDLPKDGDYNFSLKGIERELDEFFINRLSAYRNKTSEAELKEQLTAYSTRLENVIKVDLPKWKRAKCWEELDRHVAVIGHKDKVALTDVLDADDYYIEFSDLITLPKEE